LIVPRHARAWPSARRRAEGRDESGHDDYIKAMQTAFQHCAALVREADRDRYLATLFAPAKHREALLALYAFNVEIARVRDMAREPMPGEIRLQWWREVLGGERQSEARANPVAAALRETLMRYKLAASPLVGLIDARAFDLYGEPMATVAALESYAVATQAGLLTMAAALLGGETAADFGAADYGIAFAIAGMLGDFGRHAARRQLYVPLDILRRHKVGAEEIFAGEVSAGLDAALAEMRGLARRHLVSARAKWDAVPPPALPALLPMALVDPQLTAMERQAARPFDLRPLSLLRRQWLLWRAARRGMI
jgi:15-cis-phytoene synthase